MSNQNSIYASRLFQFYFKGVIFDTDEGLGNDDALADLLNERYGNMKLEIRAETEEEALEGALHILSEESGYCVKDADYEMQIS